MRLDLHTRAPGDGGVRPDGAFGELAAARQLTVEVFDGGELAAAGWPSISAGSDLLMHVYQSREYLDAWVASIGRARNARCFLIVVRDSDRRPLLYLPLAIESRFKSRILCFMDGGVADFNAPILAARRHLSRAEFITVWREILTRLPAIDFIDLKKMPRAVGGARNPLTYLDCRPQESNGHAIDLAARYDGAPNARSLARMRRKLARQRQRLGELGPMQFQVNPPRPLADKIADRLTGLKREQYLRTSGRDFFATPGVREFYARMTAPDRLGLVSHLSALTCGDTIVSAHLGFAGRGRFYYVLPAFDTAFRSLAVGFLLLDHLIEHCAEERYETFDLGEGDFPYKTRWATHRMPLLACEQAVTTVGMLYGRLRSVRRLARMTPVPTPCAN